MKIFYDFRTFILSDCIAQCFVHWPRCNGAFMRTILSNITALAPAQFSDFNNFLAVTAIGCSLRTLFEFVIDIFQTIAGYSLMKESYCFLRTPVDIIERSSNFARNVFVHSPIVSFSHFDRQHHNYLVVYCCNDSRQF